MGIRESFQENPPGEKDLNIHDIVIEKDEKKREELPFDPEIEISNSSWQGMKTQLDSDRSQEDWGIFSLQAMNMKILFPERVKELDLNEPTWQGMKAKLDSDRSQEDWWSFSWQAMRIKILFPERASELDLNEPAWQGMKAQLDSHRSQGDWWNFSWQAMGMKILVAHKVQVTNEGLEITMRKPETFRPEKKTPRPERRQF